MVTDVNVEKYINASCPIDVTDFKPLVPSLNVDGIVKDVTLSSQSVTEYEFVSETYV
jgi:hypothetical protein